MASDKTAKSGWVVAAKEGATVDGRTITKQWIEDMAETYSIEEYTAVIWPEHFRSSWGPFDGKNWGTVDAVKAAKKGGKLCLFVKLTANQYLLDANKDGQKLFMSIEPNLDFAGSGKCYLQGLAVTDSPASTGTTMLKFSIGDNEIQHDYSELESLQHSDFIIAAPQSTANTAAATQEQAKSLFNQLINLFSTSQTAEAEPNIAEENTMTKEQHDALMGQFGEITTKIEAVENKFSDLESKVEKFSAAEAQGEEQAPAEEQAEGITAEQFATLNESLGGLAEKFSAIETKFNALSQETAGQEPDAAGNGESINLV
jgi:hypothetical protein